MYFITTIERLPDVVESYGCTRCVGYYESFKDAEDSVINNDFNIFEYLYDYCVIEKIEQGIYKYSGQNNRWFYKFNLDTKNYEYIKEPEEFKHMCGFSIG